jgi:hypothetical protein
MEAAEVERKMTLNATTLACLIQSLKVNQAELKRELQRAGLDERYLEKPSNRSENPEPVMLPEHSAVG